MSLLCVDKMEEPQQLRLIEIIICKGFNIRNCSQNQLRGEEAGGVGIRLELEVSVVAGVALICLLSFLLYLYLAKREVRCVN